GGGGMILEDYLDLDGGTGGIGERQRGNNARIPQGDGADSVEVDAVPDTGFAAADGGDPIPPDGSVKGGIIRAESAAVLIGAHHGGFLDAAGRGGFEDAHSDGVFAAGEQLRGHIEAAADEGALDAAEFFAVEEDFGFPIDAVEVEPDLLAGKRGRGGELVAIPEVGLEKGVGDHQLVVGEVGVGEGAGVEVAGEHGAGDGGGQPGGIVEAGLGEGEAIRFDQRIALHAPGAAREFETSGRRAWTGLGLGDRATSAEDFEFAEDVALGCGGLAHEDSHVPGQGGWCEFQVVGRAGSRQSGDRFPVDSVVGYLEGRFGGAADPREGDAVECAGCAQVDIDPLFAAAGAFPGAGEAMRAADGDAPGATEQRDFGDAPGARAGIGEGDAVEAVARGRGELDGGADFARQARHAFAVAEFAPGGAVVGSGDDASPNFEIGGGRLDGTVDRNEIGRAHV